VKIFKKYKTYRVLSPPNSRNKHNKLIDIAVISAFILMLSGCGRDFLAPQPKSFYTPGNTLTTVAGIQAIVNNLNITLVRQYYGETNYLMTEYFQTDVGVPVESTTNEELYNADHETPTFYPRLWQAKGYFSRAYNAMGYVTTIVSSINKVTDWKSTQQRNKYLAIAYFHEAYWYYRLVNQFGDVPVYLAQITKPRTNFYTYKREAILKLMRDHMKWGVQYLPKKSAVKPGQINQAAGYQLLTKIYLELRQFKDAVASASKIINSGNFHLMEHRFGNGPHANDPRFNVMWDLFQKQNISSSENTEAILTSQDKYNIEGSPGVTDWIRDLVPLYFYIHGVTAAAPTSFTDSLGRGVGFLRPTPYYEFGIWNNDPNDLRHDEVNWFFEHDFYYNDKAYLNSHDLGNLYHKTVTKARLKITGFRGNFDTTRTFYGFPYNKVFVPDETKKSLITGGYTDWYIYRLAGTYLLRAEAYYWQNKLALAAADMNKVRERSHEPAISPANVNINTIFDERARELWWEEPRKTEMTRVSYIMAQLGRDGYNFKNMAHNNWWYDRTMKYNVFYRKQLFIHGFATNQYKLEPHQIYWPIPQSEIDANSSGHINQNIGYEGSDNNIKPKGYDEIKQLPGAQAQNNLKPIK
jgi:hypothetical protein